jgi:hypothetical protein
LTLLETILNLSNRHARTIHNDNNTLTVMAKSKYEYVKEFETDDKMLRNVYVLVRIDGKGFHK